MALSLEAQSLLRRVRARLDEDWLAGTYSRVRADGSMGHCLVGLLRIEASGNSSPIQQSPSYHESLSALVHTTGRPMGHLESWNDQQILNGRPAAVQAVKDLIDKVLANGS